MAQPGDEEDDDLKRAIALSLQDIEKTAEPVMEAEGNNGKSTGGIMGLDRKTMEQERLARIASRKREAPISPPQLNRDKTAPVKRLRTETPTGTAGSPLYFPRGTVKKTFSPYHPDDPGIKIEEILDKDNLKTAVLSTFMIDPDWIFSKMDVKRTKFYMILHANDDATRKMYIDDFSGVSNAKVCLPSLNGMYACMHSKLMVLFFSGFLRIVVPSANLVKYDWGETGVMENTVFLIDLPRDPVAQKSKPSDLTFFGRELLEFLEKQGVEKQVREGILNFDFAPTRNYAFVHTSAGYHFGADMHSTGFLGLSTAVRKLGLKTNEPIQLDFAASSLGSLNDGTINAIYEAAQGHDVSNRDRLKKPNEQTKKNLRIYFPTRETVRESRGGFDSAGTICLETNYFAKSDFPKALMRDYVSKRQGMLSHNKIMLVRGKEKAWAYVGSANLSESAWGRLVMDKGKKEMKLSCSNWECGVLIPATSNFSDDWGEVFTGVLDVPFEHGEGLEYKGRQPWLFKG